MSGQNFNREALRAHKDWLYTEYLIARFFGIQHDEYRNPDFLVLPNGKLAKWTN